MAYRHIVVATDLSEDAEFLLGKGARLAAALKAKLSLIYIDIHRAGYYVDLGVGDYNYTDRTFSERVKNMLNAIKGQSSYPVEEVIVSRGALTEELNRVAKEKGFDLGDLRPPSRCLEPAGFFGTPGDQRTECRSAGRPHREEIVAAACGRLPFFIHIFYL